MKYYSAIEKNGTLPFETTWMGLPSFILNEISETERQIPYDLSHVESKTKANECIHSEN